MRRRVWVLVAATTSAVILAFLIPLLLLLRTLAEDRAMDVATQEVQRITLLVANVADVRELVTPIQLVDSGSPRSIPVVLPDGTTVGPANPNDPDFARARTGAAFTERLRDGAALYVPSVTAQGTAVVRSFVPEPELHRGVRRASLIIVGLGVLLLAGALNRLAARVVELLAAERDAVADLADRLRTHLEHLERTVGAIVRDARRPVRATLAPSCDVAGVVAGRIAFWSPLADDQGRPLSLDVPDHPVVAAVDETELADVVDVLMDNVFAHTEEGTAVAVTVRVRADGAAEVLVEDAGPGLPSADLLSRGASGAGSSGLGLDIARRAAAAGGGGLELDRSARLGGLLVRVTLAGDQGGPPTAARSRSR